MCKSLLPKTDEQFGHFGEVFFFFFAALSLILSIKQMGSQSTRNTDEKQTKNSGQSKAKSRWISSFALCCFPQYKAWHYFKVESLLNAKGGDLAYFCSCQHISWKDQSQKCVSQSLSTFRLSYPVSPEPIRSHWRGIALTNCIENTYF